MTPRHLVVAYPKLSDRDLEWIQSIRRENDELSFQAILPHFTLFFPTSDFSDETIFQALREAASQISRFSFVVRSALLMPPVDGGEYSYVFLVPDEGMSSIIRLHDLIYSGDLSSSLRLDIPFVPHITVASSKNLSHCKSLCDRINSERLEIRGEVHELALVIEDGVRISPVKSFGLRSPILGA